MGVAQGAIITELEQDAAVEVERLGDAPLRVQDRGIHVVGRQIDEAHRQVGDQAVEVQPLGAVREVGDRRARDERAAGPDRVEADADRRLGARPSEAAGNLGVDGFTLHADRHG